MTTLQRIAIRFPPGTWRGIDTAGDDHSPGFVITPEVAQKLREKGYWWVARYIPFEVSDVLDEPRAGGDHRGCYSLSRAEVDWILGAGLGLLVIQWGPRGGEQLLGALGRARGEGANAVADALGLPEGIHLGCDLEGRAAAQAGRSGCLSFLARWGQGATRDARRRALLYDGDGMVPLSAQDLYGLADFDCYWSAAAGPPPNPLPRGLSIEQDPPTRVAGIACDTDTIRQDRRGEGPILTATPEIAAAWHTEALARQGQWWVDVVSNWAFETVDVE